ncbi:MAG: hypothetical protein LAT82_01525 [Nanoarchaeota archaeon]|nr:hypothetical protein [Nanoarchaeota archaeon]
MKTTNTFKTIIEKNWIFITPIIIFTTGLLYARSIEAFAGIGVMIMTLVLTFASIIGTISYRINPKLIFSILITIGVFVVSFGLLIVLVRVGMI